MARADSSEALSEDVLQETLAKYRRVRELTESLCTGLETEDYLLQSMTDASPTGWHLAHTSWFFETFLLKTRLNDYRSPDERYNYLYNSYYVAVGERHARPRRGLISRPTISEIYAFRRHVDEEMTRLIESTCPTSLTQIAPVIELGLNHEQQHQELLLTDIKHAFSGNPFYPAFRTGEAAKPSGAASKLGWIHYDEGIRHVGHEGPAFAYDNEGPRHRVFLEPFRLSNRLVTNDEYREFMADGGYERPELWLDAGWATVQQDSWRAPIYWIDRDDEWMEFTLDGLRPLDGSRPVCHVSYFEADAYARWAGRRLPTEFEWEAAAAEAPIEGNFVDSQALHPTAASDAPSAHPSQLFGDVWEWTMSHYSPYPGYRPAAGAIGEYNGKWMCNQFVLRGGSCATSHDHIRRTYRNFFHAGARWQFSGIRLADEVP